MTAMLIHVHCVVRPNLLALLRSSIPMAAAVPGPRSMTVSLRSLAEGDVGALRHGGQAASDAFNRREKAAEDMYIREREKVILSLLREKVVKQEEILAKDRAMLAAMEDQYGHVAEEAGKST